MIKEIIAPDALHALLCGLLAPSKPKRTQMASISLEEYCFEIVHEANAAGPKLLPDRNQQHLLIELTSFLFPGHS